MAGVAAWAFVAPGGSRAGTAAPAPASPAVWQEPAGIGAADAARVAAEPLAHEGWLAQAARWLCAGLAAGLLAATLSAPVQAAADGTNPPLDIDYGGFSLDNTPSAFQTCKENKKFAKRMKDAIFKITARQKKFPEGSMTYNYLQDQVERTKLRQKAYGERVCGRKDGLPRVLLGPGKSSLIVPGLMGLYTFGWIGWAGRSYLLRTRSAEKEINIDVPLALTCMASGFAWPVNAWKEIVNGEMAVPDNEIYVATF